MATLYDVQRAGSGELEVVLTAVRTVAPKNGTDFSLEELYALLRCSMVEVVSIPDDPDHILIVDEEGKLSAPPSPLNPAATKLARMDWGDWVAGPALYCRDDEVR